MALWHRKDKAERKERKRKNTAADSGDKGVTAVILAGGSSTRMGGLDKLSAVVTVSGVAIESKLERRVSRVKEVIIGTGRKKEELS